MIDKRKIFGIKKSREANGKSENCIGKMWKRKREKSGEWKGGEEKILKIKIKRQ